MKSPLDFDNTREHHKKVDKLILLGCLLAILIALLVEA